MNPQNPPTPGKAGDDDPAGWRLGYEAAMATLHLAADVKALSNAFQNALSLLGLRGLLASLEDKGRFLQIKAIGLTLHNAELPPDIEQLIVENVVGHRISMVHGGLFHQVVVDGRPLFVPDGSAIFRHAGKISRGEEEAALTALRLMLGGPVILAPIAHQETILGIAAYMGNALLAQDLDPLTRLTGAVGEALATFLPQAPGRDQLLEKSGWDWPGHLPSKGEITGEHPDGNLGLWDNNDSAVGTNRPATTTVTLNTVLGEILEELAQLVPSRSACIFLMEGGELRAVVTRGYSQKKDVFGVAFPADNDLASEIIETRRGVIFEDVEKVTEFSGWSLTNDVRSWMGIPMIVRDQAIGYLALYSETVGAYGSEQARLAQAFANQSAMAIENSRLFSETQRLLGHTQRQAGQIEQVIDLIPDGIILLDKYRRIVLMNTAAQGFLDQMAPVGAGDALERLGDEPIQKYLADTPGQTPWLELATGEPRHIFEISSRVRGSGETEPGWLLMIRNVTNQRDKERYLQLQDRMSTVGQLAAGIAHDFNNTLAAISLQTQLVLRAAEITAKERDRLAVVQTQSERASALISQILDFSHDSTADLRPMDFQAFLKDVTSNLIRQTPSSIRIELEIQEEGEVMMIDADAPRLQKVVEIMAANAIEAMPSGGVLSFHCNSLKLRPEETYPLPDLYAGSWLEFKISDTGIGMDETQQARIFEPFFTTKASDEGAGLGLTQAYGIVKQHKGFIDVESQPQEGSTFTLYLPAYARPATHHAGRDSFVDIAGQGETILLVEDDTPTREALFEILSALEYTVITAMDGEDALRIFEKHEGHIDLVISDMVMPIMGGATLYNKLQQWNPKTKMIVMTGYPFDRGGKELLDRGIVGFIQKPLRVEEIASAIRAALA